MWSIISQKSQFLGDSMAEAKDKVVFNYYIKFSTIYKLHKVKKKNNN